MLGAQHVEVPGVVVVAVLEPHDARDAIDAERHLAGLVAPELFATAAHHLKSRENVPRGGRMPGDARGSVGDAGLDPTTSTM